MSEFYSKSTDQGTKTSRENNKLDEETKEDSVDKASAYRNFIEQQQARSTTEKTKNMTLKYGEHFATNGMSSERLRQYPGWNLICLSALSLKM